MLIHTCNRDSAVRKLHRCGGESAGYDSEVFYGVKTFRSQVAHWQEGLSTLDCYLVDSTRHILKISRSNLWTMDLWTVVEKEIKT